MTREEAMGILYSHSRINPKIGCEQRFIAYQNGDVEKALNMAIKALEQTRWISVSEKLPEWDVECIVVDDKGKFGVGFYRDDAGAWDSSSWGWLERKDDVDNHDAYYMPCGIGKVIAWQPLPEPYKGE